MKFTLIGENDDNSKVTYTFEAVLLTDILDHINYFIRGCSYCPEGELEYMSAEVVTDDLV